MIDTFPFPRITANTAEGQIAQLVDYMVQFKEILEFALMNISTDNLSPDLVAKLNELGANIEKSNEARTEEIAQVSNNSLTVSDVCNSDVFKAAVQNEMETWTAKVEELTTKCEGFETRLAELESKVNT